MVLTPIPPPILLLGMTYFWQSTSDRTQWRWAGRIRTRSFWLWGWRGLGGSGCHYHRGVTSNGCTGLNLKAIGGLSSLPHRPDNILWQQNPFLGLLWVDCGSVVPPCRPCTSVFCIDCWRRGRWRSDCGLSGSPSSYRRRRRNGGWMYVKGYLKQ